MNMCNTLQCVANLIDHIRTKQEEVHRWLESYEGAKELPLDSSVDIRNAGFKATVVDYNIFQSWLNNVVVNGLED